MIRSLYIMLLLSLGLPASALTVGDVNGDGQVTAADVVLALQVAVGQRTLTAAQQVQADVFPNPGANGRRIGDGVVDVRDALAILRFAIGLTPSAVFQPQPWVSTYAGYGSNPVSASLLSTLGAAGKPPLERDGPAGQALGMVFSNFQPDGRGDLVFVGGPNESSTIRLWRPDGSTERLAGDPAEGTQKDGSAVDARFTAIGAVAWLPDGSLAVTDARTVRRLDLRGGAVTTLAGMPWILPKLPSGQTTLCVDTFADGPAAQAQFGCRIAGMAVRSDGAVYLSDTDNRRIRLLRPDGQVVTFVGDGAETQIPNDGDAAHAEFVEPGEMLLDPAGDLYVADSTAWIRRVTPDGHVTTVAGAGLGGTTDDGPALATHIYVQSMTWGPDGRLWFVDHSTRIRELTPDGQVVTVTGSPDAGHQDGSVAGARFTFLTTLRADADGGVWLWDARYGELKRIRSGVVETVAYGFPLPLNEGPARRVIIAPGSLAFGADGSLYFGEGNRIRRVTADGKSIAFVAGYPVLWNPTPDEVPQPDVQKQLDYISGLAVASDGTIDVVVSNSAVKRVATDGSISTLAGSDEIDGEQSGYRDGPEGQALFNYAIGLALDEARGRLYVADGGNHAVRVLEGSQVRTLIGPPNPNSPFGSPLAEPVALQIDAGGNLYIGDEGCVFRSTPDGALSRRACIDTDLGPFTFLGALAVASDGTIYAAGPQRSPTTRLNGSVIYRARPGETDLTPWIGDLRSPGYVDGPASRALFGNIYALALGPDGALYVADGPEGVIRRIEF